MAGSGGACEEEAAVRVVLGELLPPEGRPAGLHGARYHPSPVKSAA